MAVELESPLDDEGNLRGVLLSIHMTSNRPDNLVSFLDNLEEKTTDPRLVEVVLKIDDTDVEMNDLLAREKAARPFRITFISTPLEGGFYGLWKWYDELLRIADPHAYFVVGLNDEMYFTEAGWDLRLMKYVGLHPDHIYRLRTSMHRERNTFDYWEACCAGDLAPIMTRRWLDLSGGWCPCNGPDSFQNAVAFYFGWLHRHDTFGRPYRERVVHDIEFGAAGANIGLDDPKAFRRRMRGALKAWFILVSHAMQQEAAHRAQILNAHIWILEQGKDVYYMRDDVRRRNILAIHIPSGQAARRRSYRLSRVRIGLTNFLRKFDYAYYGGAGGDFQGKWWSNYTNYLKLRHEWLDRLSIAQETAHADAADSAQAFMRGYHRLRQGGAGPLELTVYALFYVGARLVARLRR